jgi:hypothetical protein
MSTEEVSNCAHTDAVPDSPLRSSCPGELGHAPRLDCQGIGEVAVSPVPAHRMICVSLATWWFLVVVGTSGTPPAVVGRFDSEAACLAAAESLSRTFWLFGPPWERGSGSPASPSPR